MIAHFGINIGLSLRFSDHYAYSQKDIENIILKSKNKGIDILITTEKDAARLCGLMPALCGVRILVLPISLKIMKKEERFFERLSGLYNT